MAGRKLASRRATPKEKRKEEGKAAVQRKAAEKVMFDSVDDI